MARTHTTKKSTPGTLKYGSGASVVFQRVPALVLIVSCLLHHVPESHCKSVLPSSQTFDRAANVLDGESHVSEGQSDNEQDRIERNNDLSIQYDSSLIENELLVVTILKESSPAEKDHVTFWVDRALVYMTVAVEKRGRAEYVLVDQFGNRPFATVSTWTTIKWTVHRPTVGPWLLLHEGEGRYEVTVQGVSSLDIEVSLFHTDISKGVDQLINGSPTAGYQIRTIVDIIGSEVTTSAYNVSLVTSDGQELASNWLRPAGGLQDPQYAATFTWPVEAVYIRVYGEETDGSVFERQSPSIITPILIDLTLLGGTSSDVIGPEGSLTVRFRLLNRGQSGTFHLAATVDNDVLSAIVSPAQIRLGHLGSFVGSVTVSVPQYSAPTSGLLTVRAWSGGPTDSPVVQSATLLLSSSSTAHTDLDPPSCQTLALTGNCNRHEMTSATCSLRHWTVRASVEDEVSGLQQVTFVDVTAGDFDSVAPFEEGAAGVAVGVVFNATCCKDTIQLDTADVAGNKRLCQFFQAEIEPPHPATPSSPPEHSAITTTTTTATANANITTPTTTTPRVSKLITTNPGKLNHNTSSSWTSRPQGNSGSSKSTRVLPTRMFGGDMRTTVVPATDLTVLLNGSYAASDTVTDADDGSKKHKGDYSTLKMASIILGSIGGLAGVSIALICAVFFVRYRRLQRQSRDSEDNPESSGDNDHHHQNHHHHHHHHHHRNRHRNHPHHHRSGDDDDDAASDRRHNDHSRQHRQISVVPDLLQSERSGSFGNSSTPL